MMTATIAVERVRWGRFTGEMDEHTGQLPYSWDDVSWKLLKKLAPLLLAQPEDPLKVTPSIILSILPWKKKYLKHLDIEHYETLYQTLDFMKKQVRWTAAKNPRNFILKGPAHLLVNYTFDQLIISDKMHARWGALKDKKSLNEFCAATHTLFGTEFSTRAFNLKAFLFRFKSKAYKLAMVYEYQALRNSLSWRYKKAFARGGEGGKVSEIDPWLSLRVSLAGEKFGNPEEVGATKAHHILLHLHDTRIANEQVERERKSRKR